MDCRTDFLFFWSGTPFPHPNPPRRCGSPAGGLAGAILGTFAVRAQSCVRRSNVGACVYVAVAPSNLDMGAIAPAVRPSPRGTRPSTFARMPRSLETNVGGTPRYVVDAWPLVGEPDHRDLDQRSGYSSDLKGNGPAFHGNLRHTEAVGLRPPLIDWNCQEGTMLNCRHACFLRQDNAIAPGGNMLEGDSPAIPVGRVTAGACEITQYLPSA